MHLNTFLLIPTLETHRNVEKIPWVYLPLLLFREGQVCVCMLVQPALQEWWLRI